MHVAQAILFTVLAVWAFQRLMGVNAQRWKEQASAAQSGDGQL
jgi:hypothetical protein